MGTLNDFFVGDRNLAAVYDGTIPISDEDRVEYGGLTDLELESLHEIIGVEHPDGKPLEFVQMRDGGEQLVFVFAPWFTSALAGASELGLEEWSASWAKTEGMQDYRDEVRGLLGDLNRLAIRAMDRGCELYFWLSV